MWTRILGPMCLICVFSFLACSSGCTSRPPEIVVSIVETSGDTVRLVDSVYAPTLERALTRAETMTEASRDAFLDPYIRVADAILIADDAVNSAELAIQHWARIGAVEGLKRLGCLGVAMADLISVMEEQNVPIPQKLRTVVDTIEGYAGLLCA